MTISRLLDHVVVPALAVTASATVLGFFPGLLWVAELCSHFRIQYAGAAIAIGLLAAVHRRPRPVTAAVVLFAANAAVVLSAWSGAAAAVESRGGPRLAAVSFNLEYTNRDFAAVRNYLSARRPDVIVLAELTPEWMEQLAGLTSEYPYSLTQARNSPWGLGVWSRYPLTDARFIDLGLAGSVNVAATVAIPGHPVGLFAVHLSSPTRPARTAARDRQLIALADALQSYGAGRIGVPRIVLGDFNVTPFSPVFRNLLRNTGTHDVRIGPPWSGTWPAWMAPARIRIDHCVTDPQLRPVEAARGPASGSDHFPIEVSFEIAG